MSGLEFSPAHLRKLLDESEGLGWRWISPPTGLASVGIAHHEEQNTWLVLSITHSGHLIKHQEPSLARASRRAYSERIQLLDSRTT